MGIFVHILSSRLIMDNYRNQNPYEKQGLYDPGFEHENCGIGAVVNMKGIKSRFVVENALRIVDFDNSFIYAFYHNFLPVRSASSFYKNLTPESIEIIVRFTKAYTSRKKILFTTTVENSVERVENRCTDC